MKGSGKSMKEKNTGVTPKMYTHFSSIMKMKCIFKTLPLVSLDILVGYSVLTVHYMKGSQNESDTA